MRYLLDTNVCVDYLNARYPSVVERIQASTPGEICTSSVVAAELRYGADRSKQRRKNHARLDALFAELRCIGFDEEAARAFGRVRSRLESAGTPIGPYDTMIGAHALQLGLTLVTDSVRELRRVRGLRVENWRS